MDVKGECYGCYGEEIERCNYANYSLKASLVAREGKRATKPPGHERSCKDD